MRIQNALVALSIVSALLIITCSKKSTSSNPGGREMPGTMLGDWKLVGYVVNGVPIEFGRDGGLEVPEGRSANLTVESNGTVIYSVKDSGGQVVYTEHRTFFDFKGDSLTIKVSERNGQPITPVSYPVEWSVVDNTMTLTYSQPGLTNVMTWTRA